MTETAPTPLISARGISKSFAGVEVLRGVEGIGRSAQVAVKAALVGPDAEQDGLVAGLLGKTGRPLVMP